MTSLSDVLNGFVQTLINKGVQHVVISPGSRNFPLIKSFIAAEEFLNCISVVDERSAGFVGLGLAQATKRPVVLCCTSGTASLNYYPAIAEAYYANIPLIVVTADRPPQSIDNWEGQSIHQVDVFAKHILQSYQTPHQDLDSKEFINIAEESASLSINETRPVHINMPFEEPFYTDWGKQVFVKPNVTLEKVDVTYPENNELRKDIKNAKKILWLNGADRNLDHHNYPENLVVLSDVISNKNQAVSHWESILNAIGFEDKNYHPDLIISTGTYFVSKKLKQFLQPIDGIKHWHIGQPKGTPDPFHTKPSFVNAEVQSVLNWIDTDYSSSDYVHSWKTKEGQVLEHVNSLDWTNFNEFTVCKYLLNNTKEDAVIHLANSMPIRYFDFLERKQSKLYLANRGTSGIDGCSSTAVGYSYATDKDVYLITGDVAFFYDINAFWQKELPKNLKVVVLNNGGGGIFELIQGPSEFKDSLEWQTTNHTKNAKAMAQHFNMQYHHASDFESLHKCWNSFNDSEEISILEIETNRAVNKEFLRLFNSLKQ